MDEGKIRVLKIRRRRAAAPFATGHGRNPRKLGPGTILGVTAVCDSCGTTFEAVKGTAGDPGRFADSIGALSVACPSCGTESTVEHPQLEGL